GWNVGWISSARILLFYHLLCSQQWYQSYEASSFEDPRERPLVEEKKARTISIKTSAE
ncbi:hypothetical protein L7F22_045235, partial [Adiantum nelumboides]|nr:hypothetical protein [Adiantum nelumboides]